MRLSKLNLLLGHDRRLVLGSRNSPGESAGNGNGPPSKSSSNYACFSNERINELLAKVIEAHERCEAARKAAANAMQVALWHGWQAGIHLNKAKALVSPGDWLDWLEFNFCRPSGATRQTAWIYMRIDSENPELRDKANTQPVLHGQPDFQLLKQLKFNTVRKHALGFVPNRQRIGNRDLPRLASFRAIAREFAQIKRMHISGRQLVDFDEVREETRELYRFLRWLHGDENVNPWLEKSTFATTPHAHL